MCGELRGPEVAVGLVGVACAFGGSRGAASSAPTGDGLGLGGGLNVDAREWRGLALAASLEGFELVHGLVELAVEVGLVAHDLVEVLFLGQDAFTDAPLDLLVAEALLSGFAKRSFAVGSGVGHGFEGEEGAADDGGALEADESLVLPKGQGDSLDEGFFKGAVWIQVIEQAGTMGLPILFGFKIGDDGGLGEDGVADGVEANDGLAPVCFRSSLEHLGYISTYFLKGARRKCERARVICLVIRGGYSGA